MNNYLEHVGKEFSKLKKEGLECLKNSFDLTVLNEKKIIISKGASINIRPYEIERSGFKLGRQLKKEPSALKNIYKYHFDDLNNIKLIEIFDGGLVDMEFYSYQDGMITSYFFDSSGSIRNVKLSIMDGDLFVKDFNYGKYGFSISEYTYVDGLLNNVGVFQKQHNDESGSTYVSEFKYSNNELTSISNIFPNGYKEQVYP